MSSTDSTRPPQSLPPATAVLECPAGRSWICVLLGLILFAGGMFVLWNVVAATIITSIFFAAALVIVGLFQIVHACYARSWGALAVSLIVGLLYIAAGMVLMTDPLATSFALTLAIAALFLVSGIMRLSIAFRQWSDYGLILAASGITGVVFAGVLMLGFPWSVLVVPGLLIGIDLIFHGAWWLVVGLTVRHPGGEPHGLTAT